MTTGSVHEVNQMAELSQGSGTMQVYDRGYLDFKRLYNINLAESFFVTRMKQNCQFQAPVDRQTHRWIGGISPADLAVAEDFPAGKTVDCRPASGTATAGFTRPESTLPTGISIRMRLKTQSGLIDKTQPDSSDSRSFHAFRKGSASRK